ncbi:unnamed protein product, partial [marine sediment metagenome]
VPKSRFGGILSALIQQEALPDFDVRVKQKVTYVMQQTPCAAVTVSLIPLHSKDPLSHRKITKVSKIIYSSIVKFFRELEKKPGTL